MITSSKNVAYFLCKMLEVAPILELTLVAGRGHHASARVFFFAELEGLTSRMNIETIIDDGQHFTRKQIVIKRLGASAIHLERASICAGLISNGD